MSRGRQAEAPTEIPWRGWTDIAIRVKDEVARDRVGLISAGIAFYGLLALFPAITALVAISGLFVDPTQIAEQLEVFQGLVPQDVLALLREQASEVAGSSSGGLGVAALIGLALALWSASSGTASLMEGMNAAYDEQEERSLIAKLATRVGLTVFIILGLVLGLGVILAVPAITAIVSGPPVVETLGSILAYLMLFTLAVLGLAVVYRYGPSRDNPEFKWVSPGALVSCLLWIVASAGFAFYVKNFGTYNETFGALAGVVVLLMWFWISAFIVLLGAELNAEAEAQTRHDTTQGDNAPMGQRDAVKADQLGQTRNA